MRVRVDPTTLNPASAPLLVAHGLQWDDFAIDERAGVAYITTHRENTIECVLLDPHNGQACHPVIGVPFDERLIGSSSFAWGRGPEGNGSIAYVTTDGGLTAPPPDGVVRLPECCASNSRMSRRRRGPSTPSLEGRSAAGQLAALLVAHRRPGFYLRVLQEGDVEAGDEIFQVAAGPERMSIASISATLYLNDHPREKLERALRIPTLSPGWKMSFQSLLEQAVRGETTRGNPGLAPASGPPSAW